MVVCRAPVMTYGHRRRHRHSRSACLYVGQETAFDMAKKYVVLRTKTPQQEGGFLEAFELGLVDLNCWGDQYFDASGYPYPDEVHAFVHDWLNLSGDFAAAMRKMEDLKRDHNARIAGNADSHGQGSTSGRQPAEATKK